MKIKLENLKKIGRFRLPDGREVSIHSGTKPRRTEKLYFYLYRYQRVFITSDVRFKSERLYAR